MSFSELRNKDVVNVCDGRKLGKPVDILFNDRACVEAIVVPEQAGFFACLVRGREGCVIPWNRIKRFGDDVILVELDANGR